MSWESKGFFMAADYSQEGDHKWAICYGPNKYFEPEFDHLLDKVMQQPDVLTIESNLSHDQARILVRKLPEKFVTRVG